MIKDKDLMREAPETWCAGGGSVCGYYGLRRQFMASLSDYMNKHNLNKDDILGFSGIGCSGRFTVWQDLVTVHATHGNASNLAQGAALIKEINNKKGLVYIVSGDGDALAIGRSNFENLCHSNLDVTYLILNNGIYAMTSGQTSPTTETGVKTSSSPYGVVEKPWDCVSLALEAGASFIARTSSYPKESKTLKETLTKAFEHKGTSIVEVISFCPTQNPLDKNKKIHDVQKSYLDNSVDIDTFTDPMFSGLSPKLKYAFVNEHLQNSGKDSIVKGIIKDSKELTYGDQVIAQKKTILNSKSKTLAQRIEDNLKKNKIESF